MIRDIIKSKQKYYQQKYAVRRWRYHLIVALEDAKYKLMGMRESIQELGAALRIEETRENLKDLEAQTQAPDFWNSAEKSSKVLQVIKQGQDKIAGYERLCARLEDAIALAEVAIEENDESFVEEVQGELDAIVAEEEHKRIEVLLSGEYDKSNAIVSFHPGAGGTEAQDWAQMLYRMITRWAEKSGFQVKLTDWLDGDGAGIKSATVMIVGLNAYGYLKSENGVHRLVRVSPFDANGRRQTSFASIEVMPEFENLDAVVIREEDIEVTAHRSSGAGGQHINKTDSAIRIVHKPTGIVVGCQTERSQLQNKETAMRMLKAKLMEIKIQERLDTIEDIQGNKANIEWGSQIRSYVFMPYTLVTDKRTGYETGNIQAVMDGDLDGFINAYLKMTSANQ
ncbi:MAG: peptide chain release factor 2 [Clostridia bacterium]|nr:peptide chain release factor 2 [Clostridia bacterium]